MTEFLVGGRGYGKNLRLKEWLREQAEQDRREQRRAEYYNQLLYGTPWAKSVTWSCKRPTEPVYAVGTNGWMMEQYESRLTPEMRAYNRKLAEDNAALYDRAARALGLKRT